MGSTLGEHDLLRDRILGGRTGRTAGNVLGKPAEHGAYGATLRLATLTP
ncbi:hypothetical protein AB0G79_15920 [Streptomyces sp. NPDC020807]